MSASLTVESFQATLPGFPVILASRKPIEMIEDALLKQLAHPERLLRWAIVAVNTETGDCRCEGAYLKSAP